MNLFLGRLVKRRLPSVFGLVVPPALILGACSEPTPPKTPSTPVQVDAGAPLGIKDTPSSTRALDVSAQPSRPALTGAATGSYQQALQAFANGDLPTAKRLFEQTIQADPRSHQAFYSLGVVQERLREPAANASYRQAFTLVPDYEPAIVAYAMLLAKSNQLSDAERFLTEKRGQMPKSAAVAAALAEVKSLQKDTGSAQRIAQEALKLNPDYRPAMVIIARDHFRNRRLDLALYALLGILDGAGPANPPRDKDNGEGYLLRGLIWKEQGNRAGALEQFRAAYQKRPDLVEARVEYSTLLLQSGGASDARPILEGAVRFDGENIAAHLNLGDAYRLLGEYAEAKREFEWVLGKDPRLPQVHYDLGLLYLFAPSVPGMTPKQQIGAAISELKKFQELRARDERDDSDELLNTAKVREGEIAAGNVPAAPAPSARPATSAQAVASAVPAGGGSAVPATSATPAASVATPVPSAPPPAGVPTAVLEVGSARPPVAGSPPVPSKPRAPTGR